MVCRSIKYYCVRYSLMSMSMLRKPSSRLLTSNGHFHWKWKEKTCSTWPIVHTINSRWMRTTVSVIRLSFVAIFHAHLRFIVCGDGHMAQTQTCRYTLNGCRLLRSQNQANLNKAQSFIIDVHVHATWIHKHGKSRMKKAAHSTSLPLSIYCPRPLC